MTPHAGWTKRYSHTSVAMPDGSIVLMGGRNMYSIYNDVWRSTDHGSTWTMMNGSAGWRSRWELTSVTMPDGSIVLMGGVCDGYTGCFDTWRSEDNGATWSLVNASAGWLARDSSTSVEMPDGSIVLAGGGAIGNDVWQSTNYGATWTQIKGSAEWPRRWIHSMVVVPDGGIVLMGGMDETTNYLNDVWRSVDYGTTWNLMNASAGWSPREGHNSVAMPDGSIVLMGGVDFEGVKNDLWRSTDNGATWSQLPNAGWAGRYQHSSVAMPDGSIILMGGYDGTNYLNDVWRFQPAGSLKQNPSHTYTIPGTYMVTLQAYNVDGFNSTRKIGYITVLVPAPAITGITPATGVNTTSVSITKLAGTNFNTTIALAVKLNRTGHADIVATDVIVVDSTTITCTFPITHQPAGLWNVVVTNPDGQDAMLVNGFTITEPGTTTIPTTEPTIISESSSSSDNETAMALPSVTNTVNAGGSSAVSRVIVTGTGIIGLIVTGTLKPRPDDGPYPPGIVYQYIDLVPARFKTITGAEIFFSVPQSWLDEHQIAPKNVIVYHLTENGWVALPIKVLNTKDGNVYFSATSPGFSLFAIAGTKGNATPVTVSTSQMTFGGLEQEQTPVQTANVPVTTQTTVPPATNVKPSAPSLLLNIVLVIAAIGIMSGGGFMIRRWWIQRQNPALFREYD
ncbi:MAG: PGF-pre-PGF domain-containing protein [Methanoregula sp.]|nr:PGF-pre-PGF domain-containing protein [Methanoregula sp.]